MFGEDVFMFSIKKFFKDIPKDFMNIYVDGYKNLNLYDEYLDTSKSERRITGKKKVSVKKVLFRVAIILIFIMYLFFIIRIIIAGL